MNAPVRGFRSLERKAAALRKVAKQIEFCRRCRRDGIGKAVVGEGSADAQVVFVGEAPGRHEAESGRPFVGKAGQWLRRAIRGIGLHENPVFITSAIKYRRKRRKPTVVQVKRRLESLPCEGLDHLTHMIVAMSLQHELRFHPFAPGDW